MFLCFFASGFAGLVYEVVWSRKLALFLGVTTYAHTAVITAYMVGLAAGSFWFGRRADRVRNPLRTYALLEVAIGVYGVVSLGLLDVLQELYAGFLPVIGVTGTSAHIWRFVPALLILLLPTFLMGGTLPLMVRGLSGRFPQMGAMTGRLYGINTLGATCGAFAAGFLLIPTLGGVTTVVLAAAANALAAIGVWRFKGVANQEDDEADFNASFGVGFEYLWESRVALKVDLGFTYLGDEEEVFPLPQAALLYYF